MTREEMLNGLYEIKNWKCNGDAKTHEVVTEAIKTLEQEPCDDAISAISRQAVVDMAGLSDWFDSSDNYNEFVFALSELPPVNPQPKMGHWIFDDECKEHGHCSYCGYGKVDLVDGAPHNYCPHCGAKMQEVEE